MHTAYVLRTVSELARGVRRQKEHRRDEDEEVGDGSDVGAGEGARVSLHSDADDVERDGARASGLAVLYSKHSQLRRKRRRVQP